MKEAALKILKKEKHTNGDYVSVILIAVVYALLYIGDAIVSLKEK
jgi:hypothetical protein